ncbi:hypothetical protein [Geomonas ferrireducens]|uniref:hypothetical protein n=1 Tax=Geomonas ferrireducens TaxID=2570227 RepID=UPI0010A8A5B6|nr:hypothetical protein [Geomonas ferrireducens]
MKINNGITYEEIIQMMSEKVEQDMSWLRSEECQYLIEIAMRIAPPHIRNQIEAALNVSDEEIRLKLREYETKIYRDGAFHVVN